MEPGPYFQGRALNSTRPDVQSGKERNELYKGGLELDLYFQLPISQLDKGKWVERRMVLYNAPEKTCLCL